MLPDKFSGDEIDLINSFLFSATNTVCGALLITAPKFHFLHVNAQTLYLDKQKTKFSCNTLAATKRLDHTKKIDTHIDRFSQKTNHFTDTRAAQILCVSTFLVCFLCRPHKTRAQAINKDNFVFKATALKADARFFY